MPAHEGRGGPWRGWPRPDLALGVQHLPRELPLEEVKPQAPEQLLRECLFVMMARDDGGVSIGNAKPVELVRREVRGHELRHYSASLFWTLLRFEKQARKFPFQMSTLM